jgi:FkbM family methyltransferase
VSIDEPMRAWRSRPVHTTARFASSIVHRRSQHFQTAVVDVGHGISMHTDLRSATGLGLFRYGLTAPELVLIERLLPAGATFIDAGAHIGTLALVAAQCVGPRGRVVAFEPAARAAEALAANARLNTFHWLEVHECGLAGSAGRRSFVELADDAAGFSGFAPPSELTGEVRFIDVTTLDDIVADDRVDFLKVDVEGSEAQVLASATRVLSTHRPHLLVEIEPDHLARQGSSTDEIDEILLRHGYTMWELSPIAKPRLRRLIRSVDRSVGVNIFATADPARVEEAGFELIGR